LRIADLNINAAAATLETHHVLKLATMRELFTRGLRGETLKDSEFGPVPESWQIAKIDDLGKVVTGNTPPTKNRENYDGGTIPFIAPGDIEHGKRTESTEKHVSAIGLATSRQLPRGATCFVCIGSTIGKVGMTTEEVSCTNQQINSVIPYDEYDPGYVFHLLTHWSDRIKMEQSPSPVPIMSKGVFEKIEIWVTKDPFEQQEIAKILDAIDDKIDLHKHKKAVLEELFRALLHKLMAGEIRVTDLDLSALEAKAAA
jgi:type I restriction enzyme, S subunit